MTYTSSIRALEITPGTLLKLTCDATTDKFAAAAKALNVGLTCGLLASLMAGGLENTSTALLANHVKTAIVTIPAGEYTEHVPGNK